MSTQARPRLTEQEYFAWCKERALAAFRDNPRLIITHVAAQFDGFWLGIAEARRWAKNPGVFFLAQGVPALLAIIALYLNRKRLPPVSVAVFCAILIVYPLPYYLTAGAARYRHPIDGIIYLGAATLIVCYQRKKKPA